MTTPLRAGMLAACAFAFVSSATAGELKVTMQDGRVTVVADNVPVRQILAEWAKVGQTKVVGGDKIPGGPVTLRLENVPERQALDVLLRAASGFMVVERAVPEATLARFDRILILPTSSAPAGGSAPSGPAGRGGMQGGSPGMAPSQPAPVAAAPEPAEESVPEDTGNAQDENRPPETNFDYANPQQFLQRRLEQLQQQQQQNGGQAPTPTTFPGTVSPYGSGGVPTQSSPTAVPGTSGGTSARPGEIIKAPVQQPPMVNPYGIPVQTPTGAAATPMQPDRAKYANPYQPQQPPPIQ